MPHAVFRSTLLTAALVLAFDATAAQRTFVSTSGSDANTASNCSNTAPCRSFGSALTVTDTGGEIIVLSSGGYGPVTINKSVSIIAPEGIYAGISVFSGNGITISTAGVNVTLKGLTLNGLGGTTGIYMSTGSYLTVRNCTVKNFGYGLYVTSAVQVRLLDSHLQGNTWGAAFQDGPTALVFGSRFIDNSFGVGVGATGAGVSTKVEVSSSEASRNFATGLIAQAFSGGTAELSVKDSVASRNGSTGVYAFSSGGTTLTSVSGSSINGNSDYGLAADGSGAKLVASGNTITRNNYGLAKDASAVLQSTGDNTVTDNVAGPTSGTITALAKM